jgi:hypothetical protein
MTWDRRLYFPSEGRRAGDFFALKNPTASAGFEPTNLGSSGLHKWNVMDKWVMVLSCMHCPAVIAFLFLGVKLSRLPFVAHVSQI